MSGKDSSAKIRAAYVKGRRRGHSEAEEYLCSRLTAIKATNAHMLTEILRLDSVHPVTGVVIPLKTARHISLLLKRNNPSSRSAQVVDNAIMDHEEAMLQCFEDGLSSLL